MNFTDLRPISVVLVVIVYLSHWFEVRSVLHHLVVITSVGPQPKSNKVTLCISTVWCSTDFDAKYYSKLKSV